MIKRFLTLAFGASLLMSNALQAQNTVSWLRYPAISPDGSQIAFTYKGDLYLVPTSGGKATQLTFHEAHDFKPVWSRDGQHISFASDRYCFLNVPKHKLCKVYPKQIPGQMQLHLN